MNKFISTVSLVLFLLSCNEPTPSSSKEEPYRDTVSPVVTVTPPTDHEKVIAFVTTDPFDYSEVDFTQKPDLSLFHDTISRTLDSLQVKDLFDAMISPVPENSNDSHTVADCFYPRHNIFFLDSNDHMLHYILVCFECNRIKTDLRTYATLEEYRTLFSRWKLPSFNDPSEHQLYYDSLKQAKH